MLGSYLGGWGLGIRTQGAVPPQKFIWGARPQGSLSRTTWEIDMVWRSPGAWPSLFWVIFHRSHVREGNKEPCVSRLSPRDLGLQGLSCSGQHPPSKVHHKCHSVSGCGQTGYIWNLSKAVLRMAGFTEEWGVEVGVQTSDKAPWLPPTKGASAHCFHTSSTCMLVSQSTSLGLSLGT